MYKFRSLILSFLTVFASAVLGMRLRDEIPHAALFSVAALTLLVIMLLLNVILEYKIKNRLEKRTERENLNEHLMLHAKAKENFSAAMRRMMLAAVIAGGYIAALLLLSVAFCSFSGAAFGFTFTVIPGWYFVFCVVDRICCVSFRPVHIDTIAPGEYPAISKIIDEVRDIYEIRDRKLFILPENTCNAGIAEIPGGYSLYLGVPLGSVLDGEELRQIIIHEFAHVKNLDTRIGFISAMLMTFMAVKSVNPAGMINLMFRYAALKYNTVYSKYRISSTFVSEENADAAIVKYGNPQLCIDAMSKIGCYGYYVRENRYNLFADYETLPEHVCSVNVRHFRDALERRGAAWKDMIKKELPAQLNSHPTFNQRRENLGVNDFNIDIGPSHSALTGEWARLAKFTDRRIADRMKQDYGKKRRKFYTRSIERVKEWEESDRTRPPEEMRPVIDAYMNLMRIDEAERLCAQTAGRADNDNAKAYPLFMSGQIKLNACDSGGIGLIRRAIAIKADYTAPGMNLIGEFCRQTGMKAELEAHRAAAPEAIQRAKDTVGRAAVLRRRDRLSPVPDNGDMKAHIDRITGLGQGNVIEIYAVRKTIGDDFFTDAFVIKFKPRLDTEIADELLFDIFCYLDAFPSKNHRSVFAYNKATAFAVKKISKSRVYKA